jgi:hypothetical protein
VVPSADAACQDRPVATDQTCDLVAARRFINGNARLLERHLFSAIHEKGDPALVVAALAAYRNADGGFGHGLEPDKLSPDSQPLDVEFALHRLVAVVATKRADDSAEHIGRLGLDACSWLASVAGTNGLVPILLPGYADHPRADHWDGGTYPPALNPTAAIAAHGMALGLDHPWVRQAAAACLSEAESGGLPTSAPALLTLTKLLEVTPVSERTNRIAARIQSALPTASYIKLEPEGDHYGITPLDFAPNPAAAARHWFDERLIDGHLDLLEAEQQPDGGWPLSWQPPTPAASLHWRGIRTLEAVTTLAAYGRVDPGHS